MREKLPDKRQCVTQRLKINGQTVHFTVGLYKDGRPGELFIDMHKTGTAVRAWCGSTAKLMSLMLQYGIPLHEIVKAMVGQGTEPFGRVPVEGHPMIEDASGVLDAIVRCLALDHLASSVERQPKPIATFFRLVEGLEAPEVYDLVEAAGESEALEAFLEKFH